MLKSIKRKRFIMRMFLSMAIIFVALFAFACPAQPTSVYEAKWSYTDVTVTQQVVFKEVRATSTGFVLQSTLSYPEALLADSLTSGITREILSANSGATTIYDITEPNDGQYVRLAVYLLDTYGTYGGGGISGILTKSKVPVTPAFISFIKKN